MNILFVSSEVAPFSKTGGLGDVAGALPGALAELGHDVVVVTPLYGTVKRDGFELLQERIRLRFPFGEQEAALWSAPHAEHHEIIFLDHPGLYGRPGIYTDGQQDYGDNHRRFAFLSIGALATAQALGFVPDIVHCNDWQTGLTPIALQRGYRGTDLGRAKSVFTIHNLAYQGWFSKSVMGDLGLPWDLFRADGGLEFHDSVNFMKAGLTSADALTTVSRRYAEEIQGPELGCQLDGLLRARRNVLHGIVNGVDYSEWDPATDKLLPANFSAGDLSGKRLCKKDLLEYFGLPTDEGTLNKPMFAVVSRLADQKGIDLLVSAMHTALEADLTFVALGSGDKQVEHELQHLAWRFRGKCGVKIGFDAKLSHRIEAGADFFCMPSRYEPCGLNQMYSLRYGTVPVVRATGGLDDTVVDISSDQGTGVKFGPFDRGALLYAIYRALQLYQAKDWYARVQQRGMGQDFSWAVSARKYVELYESLQRR